MAHKKRIRIILDVVDEDLLEEYKNQHTDVIIGDFEEDMQAWAAGCEITAENDFEEDEVETDFIDEDDDDFGDDGDADELHVVEPEDE